MNLIKKAYEDKDGNKIEPIQADEQTDNFQLYLDEQRYRVYKGGSWNDVAYYLSPFTRRYFAEDSSASTIGFRCVMEAAIKDPEAEAELALKNADAAKKLNETTREKKITENEVIDDNKIEKVKKDKAKKIKNIKKIAKEEEKPLEESEDKK